MRELGGGGTVLYFDCGSLHKVTHTHTCMYRWWTLQVTLGHTPEWEPVVYTEAEWASVLAETQMAGGPAFDGIKEVGGPQIAQGLDRALNISAGASMKHWWSKMKCLILKNLDATLGKWGEAQTEMDFATWQKEGSK